MQNDHDLDRTEGAGDDGNVEVAGTDDQKREEEAASSREAGSEGADDGAEDEADAEMGSN